MNYSFKFAFDFFFKRMYQSFILWLESKQMPCFYKKFLGVDCPGCGMQRAFIELLKGNFLESIKIYPALIPTIIMLVYLILHLKLKFKKGADYLIIMFIFTALIIIINYLIKLIINH